jgi:hypothetical protein
MAGAPAMKACLPVVNDEAATKMAMANKDRRKFILNCVLFFMFLLFRVDRIKVLIVRARALYNSDEELYDSHIMDGIAFIRAYGGYRERKIKSRSFIYCRLSAYHSAVLLYDPFDQHEAYSSAFVFADAMEALKRPEEAVIASHVETCPVIFKVKGQML